MGKRRQVKRGQRHRFERSVILIGTEGRNKTERYYFRSLGQTVNGAYSIQFARGNSTDPVGIVKDTIKSSEDVCTDPGDLAFAVFDTDADQQKQALVDKAAELAEKNSVEIITSTPCFEVWFLQHFRRSTHAFRSNAEVINELQRYIAGYEKNADVIPLIADYTEKAIENAEALEEYHDSQGRRKYSVSRNPSTEVYRVVERVLEK